MIKRKLIERVIAEWRVHKDQSIERLAAMLSTHGTSSGIVRVRLANGADEELDVRIEMEWKESKRDELTGEDVEGTTSQIVRWRPSERGGLDHVTQIGQSRKRQREAGSERLRRRMLDAVFGGDKLVTLDLETVEHSEIADFLNVIGERRRDLEDALEAAQIDKLDTATLRARLRVLDDQEQPLRREHDKRNERAHAKKAKLQERARLEAEVVELDAREHPPAVDARRAVEDGETMTITADDIGTLVIEDK